MLAIYIPLVPYIIWIAVILAWVIAVVEAVVAAPLWMLTHVSGEGEGIATGAGEAGYKFVAAVFLRPSLSVISFFVGSLLVLAIGEMINSTFSEVIQTVQGDSMTGMFTMFGFIGVYTGLCSMLINRSFGLTLSLPSTILKWFGSNLNGDSADDGEVKENIKIIGGAAISSSHGTATAKRDPVAGTSSPPPAAPTGGGGEGGREGGGGVDTDTGAGKMPTKGRGEGSDKA